MYTVLHLFDNSNISTSLSKGELSVYQYIQENMELIDDLTSESLAVVTFSSPATINRMAKKLGMEGFNHLKHALIDDLKKKNNTSKYNEILSDTTRLLEKINYYEADQLAKRIKDGKILFIYSTGATRIAAQYLERQLLNIGIKCIDIEQQKMLENFSGENLLILSSSGETLRTLDLVNNLHYKNNILAITAKNSSLDRLSELSYTHNILIDKLDHITREQQIHMLVMINDLVTKL